MLPETSIYPALEKSRRLRRILGRFQHQVPYGLVVRIRGSHPRGPGSIPGVGTNIFPFCNMFDKRVIAIQTCLPYSHVKIWHMETEKNEEIMTLCLIQWET